MTDLTAKYYNQLPQAQGGMMAQHTPGPWTVYHDDEGVEIRANDDLMGTIINGKEMDANAQLIEAAPELLAACLSCVAVLHPLLGETGPCAEAWAKARAAILKACPEGL